MKSRVLRHFLVFMKGKQNLELQIANHLSCLDFKGLSSKMVEVALLH
jgi:hypothetical protein